MKSQCSQVKVSFCHVGMAVSALVIIIIIPARCVRFRKRWKVSSVVSVIAAHSGLKSFGEVYSEVKVKAKVK